jgi:hypothetical protein
MTFFDSKRKINTALTFSYLARLGRVRESRERGCCLPPAGNRWINNLTKIGPYAEGTPRFGLGQAHYPLFPPMHVLKSRFMFSLWQYGCFLFYLTGQVRWRTQAHHSYWLEEHVDIFFHDWAREGFGHSLLAIRRETMTTKALID